MYISDADLDRFAGKTVVLHFKDGSHPIEGRCVGLTPSYDNDSGVDTLEIVGQCFYSIDTPDIDRVDIKS